MTMTMQFSKYYASEKANYGNYNGANELFKCLVKMDKLFIGYVIVIIIIIIILHRIT